MHQTHRVVQKTMLLMQYIGLLHCFHHMAKKLILPFPKSRPHPTTGGRIYVSIVMKEM